MYDKPTANIILIGEKLKSISSKIRNKIRMFSLSTFIQLNIRSLAMAIRQENEIKGIQIGKEEIKLSLFADDMTVHTKNPKDATKKLLKHINGFSKVAEYKINIQKSVEFLYRNNELSQREMKKAIPLFHNCIKNNKLPQNKSIERR